MYHTPYSNVLVLQYCVGLEGWRPMILNVFRRKEPCWSGHVHICGGVWKSRWSGCCKPGLSYKYVEGDLHVKVVGVLQGDPLSPTYNVEGCCKAGVNKKPRKFKTVWHGYRVILKLSGRVNQASLKLSAGFSNTVCWTS